MPRTMLSDELWSKHREIMRQFTIYDKPGLRMAVEGVLFRIRVGCPWRDLPEAFGKWNSVYKKFNQWSKNGIWLKLFQSLTSDPDTECVFIDGSYVKAHQHSAGAAGDEPQAIGKSRAGNTSKIHLAVDAYGFPIRFRITGRKFNVKSQMLKNLEQWNTPDHIRNLRKALIIFHSPVDEVVDIGEAARIYQAAKHPKSFISLDNSDHLVSKAVDAE